MQLGEAGMYRVASELLRRGHHVFFPTIDDGIDLFTADHYKIQVKASSIGHRQFYSFFFRHWTKNDGRRVQKFIKFRADLTHLILWGVNDDCFWVIPTSELKAVSCLRIPSPKKSSERYQHRDTKYGRYLNAWNLIPAGEGDAT